MSRYNNLRGDNLWSTHKKAANEFIDCKILNAGSKVDLIIATGSIGRKFADKYSDIDLFICCVNTTPKFPILEQRYFDFSIDCKTLNLSLWRNWSIQKRHCLSEGNILYCSSDEASKLIEESTRLSEKERYILINSFLLQLGWTGFQPKHYFEKEVNGYTWLTPSDLWIQRGDLVSAFQNIFKALDYIITLIFLINNELFPGRKWKYFLVKKLEWLPKNFVKTLDGVVSMSNSKVESYYEIESMLLEVSNDIFRKVSYLKLISDDIPAFVKGIPEEENNYIDFDR